MERLILLGESLTSLLYAASSSRGAAKIIDIWEGGSLLYGWRLALPAQLKCLDRVPILCREPNHVEELGGKPIAIDLDASFIGSEEGYKSKVTLDNEVEIQRDWILEYSRNRYYVRGGWCSIFSRLRGGVKVPRVYGELQKILVEDRALIVNGSRIEYEVILNTLPLPYVLSKLVDRELSNYLRTLKYVSLYIVSLVVKKQLSHLKVTYVGKRGYSLAAVAELPLSYLAKELENYAVIYCFVPTALGKLRAELFQKVVTELRKLRIIEARGDVLIERSYLERYGLLGAISLNDINHVIKELRKHSICLGGRLGLWQEKSIHDITSSTVALP
ncbi:MAG: hypothetical protein J7L12_05550 [Desulfurococcales archaeon]|nr:hypothetical protein [Desulfurococcales archaeon]